MKRGNKDPFPKRNRPQQQTAIPFTCLVLELYSNDVTCGRGTGATEFSGNVRFRNLIKTQKAEYNRTSIRRAKQLVAKEVYQEIHRRRGRFLRRIEVDELPQVHAWVILDQTDALEKIKQALRDRPSKKAKVVLDHGAAVTKESMHAEIANESICSAVSASRPGDVCVEPRLLSMIWLPLVLHPDCQEGMAQCGLGAKFTPKLHDNQPSLELGQHVLPGSSCLSPFERMLEPSRESYTSTQNARGWQEIWHDAGALSDSNFSGACCGNAFNNLRTIDEIVSSDKAPLDAELSSFLYALDTSMPPSLLV